ncbi:SGNH/GDSL hydrolase family protein [Methylobacterium nonmethylotrophicum]|uniref:SGNH/GDSL hydrolase family protein n=1 Tax=Methylobacterium nonmethylotrophicum TaxID=1141884 RepID=A0A4Z0NW53_9HYPH|nr:SGNH/GDSL hydrolase family protein [Methylobacterium nonmethylotrophicum]TGE01455.1 SGNH/GDSL hydrolase family protein [Methylobacterium nonmethylotrophicum]
MRKRATIWAGLAVAVLAAGIAAFLVSRPRGGQGQNAAFREARAFAVSSQLAQVEGPYSLLLGDSQSERLLLPTLCGHPAINAAIAGTRVAGLRALVGWLTLPRPPEAVVVTIGTNDLTRRQRAGRPDAAEQFRAEARALFTDLAPRARRVIATAIPPFDPGRPRVTEFYDVDAAAAYSAILSEECARAGCVFVDAYADLRDPAATARSPDGVHLGLDAAARDRIAARLEAAACPDWAR